MRVKCDACGFRTSRLIATSPASYGACPKACLGTLRINHGKIQPRGVTTYPERIYPTRTEHDCSARGHDGLIRR
jgi:hypothetical protein